MKIIVSERGLFWKPDNPALEEYSDEVLCVYLDGFGKKSDKYQSFSPEWHTYQQGRGMVDTYSRDCVMFQELKKVGSQLNDLLKNEEDILFLTDCEPSTLYPYNVIKELNTRSNLHLMTMSPWQVMGNKRSYRHRALLGDLDRVKSLIYIDSNKMFPISSDTGIWNAYKRADDYLWVLLHQIHDRIDQFEHGRYYYDFNTKLYISTTRGFEAANMDLNDLCVSYVGMTSFETYGLGRTPKDSVQTLSPRIGGRKICSKLRDSRIELARLNDIPFTSEECRSDGPCGGSCTKCDEEAEYLRNEMLKIPEDRRKYPRLSIDSEVTS